MCIRDRSLRNTLLNFRMTRSTLQLLTADLYELEDSLAKEKEFLISERPEGLPSRLFSSWVLPIETEQDLVKAIASSELDAGRIRTFLPPQELKENLKILYRNARKSMEENGANTLYIACLLYTSLTNRLQGWSMWSFLIMNPLT